MATLKEIQDCELGMLKDIDKICRENNLRYSLAWGTMLGAVRHQGFIPWDDDVDLDMSYRDYKKLKRIIKRDFSDKYFFDCESTNPGNFILYGKIRKNGTYMRTLKQGENSKHFGVWLDVFPLISLSDNKSIRKVQYKLIDFIRYINSLFAYTKKVGNKYLVELLIIKLPLNILRELIWTIVRLLGIGGSEYLEFGLLVSCGDPEDRYGKAIFKKDFFREFAEYKFGDSSFWGVKDGRRFLTKMFGEDYMTPKRYNQHTENYDDVKL